jgi:hypothetical protein
VLVAEKKGFIALRPVCVLLIAAEDDLVQVRIDLERLAGDEQERDGHLRSMP